MAKNYRFLLGCIALCLHLCVTNALGAAISHEDQTREALATLFEAKVGVMEKGYNAGPEVEAFQRSSGNHRGEAWCASFVTWCFKMVGLPVPRNSGAAAAWFPRTKVIYRSGESLLGRNPKKADLAGFSYGNGIHHIGFIQVWSDDFVITVEGNTGGGHRVNREGDGVHRMRRLKSQITLVSCWIPES